MTRFSFLHLTDLHFGLAGQAQLWPGVKEKFLDDLENVHRRCGPFHVVLFSGDFVQRGSKDEYTRLQVEVLDPLWQRLKDLGSCPTLLAVPGNHDLVRPDAKKMSAALSGLLEKDGFEKIADDFFNNSGSEYRQIIGGAFANYVDWWRQTPNRHPAVKDGLLPGDFSATLDIDGTLVGIVGLNTTFLQLDGGNFLRRLALDQRQFHAACSGDQNGDGPQWVRQHRFSLLMTHQGPDWLTKSFREYAYPEINPAGRFAVHLFGHMHEVNLRNTSVFGGKTLRQWQGTSIFGMRQFGPQLKKDRRHGYAACTIECDKLFGKIRYWPRRGIWDSTNGWRFDRDTEKCVLDAVNDDGGTVADTVEFLPVSLKAKVIKPLVAPSVVAQSKPSAAPAAISGSGNPDKILDRASSADDSELIADLLLGRWTLADLENAIGGKSDRAMRLIRSVYASGDSWRRLLAAFAASRVRIPPVELVSMAFEAGIRWGSRFPPLSFLRFTPPAGFPATKATLLAAAEQGPLPGLDNERLAIYGLGFVNDWSEVWNILSQHGALDVEYENEKLGPFAILAYLHCYLFLKTEYDQRAVLDNFSRVMNATEKLGNLGFVFSDYLDELQVLSPAKAIPLFRHLRDNDHPIPLSAVLAAINHRPSPLLLEELLALADQNPDQHIVAAAIHSAAYIGTPTALQRLKELLPTGKPGIHAAFFLAVGLTREHAEKVEIENAINMNRPTGGRSWLNDSTGNALWAAGELGIEEPDFAKKLLKPVLSDPHQPVDRGLAWLGLAKAGLLTSRAEVELAIEGSPSFVERLLIATAAARAGWPELLVNGLVGTVDNASPLYRLLPHIERDVRIALNLYCGQGGKGLVELLQLGDYT